MSTPKDGGPGIGQRDPGFIQAVEKRALEITAIATMEHLKRIAKLERALRKTALTLGSWGHDSRCALSMLEPCDCGMERILGRVRRALASRSKEKK